MQIKIFLFVLNIILKQRGILFITTDDTTTMLKINPITMDIIMTNVANIKKRQKDESVLFNIGIE